MSDCARSGRMGAGRMMDGERADARGGEGARVPRSARGSRASSSRSGSAARDAPSGARDSAPISSARGGERGSRQRSGERRRGRVPQRARARRSRAVSRLRRAGNAPRARSRDPHRGARAGVAEAHLVSRRPRGGALLERATPSAGRAVRAAIARGVLGRVRRSPPFPERPRVPPPPSDAPPRVSSRPERRPRAPRVPPLSRRSNAIGAVERESHLAARGAECAGPARRFAGDFFTSGGGTVPADLLDRARGIGYRADSDVMPCDFE